MAKEYQSEKSPIFDSQKSKKTRRKLLKMSHIKAYIVDQTFCNTRYIFTWLHWATALRTLEISGETGIGNKIRLRQDKLPRHQYSGGGQSSIFYHLPLTASSAGLGCWGAGVLGCVQCSVVQWSEWKVRSGHRTLWTLAMAGSDRPSAGAGHRVSLFTLELETKAM